MPRTWVQRSIDIVTIDIFGLWLSDNLELMRPVMGQFYCSADAGGKIGCAKIIYLFQSINHLEHIVLLFSSYILFL